VNQFINNMMSFGLLPTVTVPTRITARTATLLDNVFTNCTNDDYYTRVIYDDISDHLPVFININYNGSKVPFENISRQNKYDMSENNFLKFQRCIDSEDWSIFDSQNIKSLNPHETYNIFINKF
jgi:formyltetrahydrofolate synthetase